MKCICDPLLLGSHVIVSPVLCILPLIQNKLFFDVTRFNVILAAFDEIEKESMGVWCLKSEHTSREPSPKILVRIGVESMVRMVKITATPSVVIEKNEHL